MKWWYTLYLFFLFISSAHSQSLVQTFVDRCTGEIKTIVIPLEGSTVVVFYNRSRSFTFNDVRSGELQAWLEETYAWWQSLSPCSTNQAAQTATQTTTQNATQSTASTAASSVSPPTQGTNTTSQSSGTATQGGNTESSSSTGTGETSNSSGSNDSGGDGGSQESQGETSEGENQEGNDSSGDDSESTEESSEGEESENEEDSNDDDDGEESEDEEDSGSGSKKSNPVIVAANIATMSALDGSINLVTNVGLSRASLSGDTSNSLNIMIWDNLQQFNLNIATSFMNKEQQVIIRDGNKTKTTGGNVKSVVTTSLNAMYSFGTLNAAFGKSKVYLMKNNLAAGWASNIMAMKIQKDFMFMPTMIGFATKPYVFYKYTVSPMLATALNPVMYSTSTKQFTYNTNAMFIIGSSGSFNLTKNFYVNLGFNIIESTANLPMTWAATIGSRFQF